MTKSDFGRLYFTLKLQVTAHDFMKVKVGTPAVVTSQPQSTAGRQMHCLLAGFFTLTQFRALLGRKWCCPHRAGSISVSHQDTRPQTYPGANLMKHSLG